MKTAIAILTLSFAATGWAFGTLKSQSTSGSKRYCTYSDGTVLTINSYDVCPTTVN